MVLVSHGVGNHKNNREENSELHAYEEFRNCGWCYLECTYKGPGLPTKRVFAEVFTPWLAGCGNEAIFSTQPFSVFALCAATLDICFRRHHLSQDLSCNSEKRT